MRSERESLGFSRVYRYAAGKFLTPLIQRMFDKKVGSVVITDPDGVLIGLLFRKDGKERLEREQVERESDAVSPRGE